MERNAMRELNMYRQLGIKPNFTEIGRWYGLHRQTVAKYWRQGEEIEDRRGDRASAFDEFRDVIERKADKVNINDADRTVVSQPVEPIGMRRQNQRSPADSG